MKHEHVFNHLESIGAWYGSMGTVCEPSYDEDKLRLFGDWNPCSKELLSALEEHYELEWEDEWIQCDDCGCYFRSSPDGHAWIMYGRIIDNTCLCGDCILADPSDVIDDALNSATTSLPPFINPADHGFINMNGTFESGLHSDMNANPPDILARYQRDYPTYDFIFANLENSQFYITFELWGRPRETE